MRRDRPPPQVTIVTPTWNRRKLLRETIASVRAQQFGAWELIVVDDGSDDGTLEELEQLAREEPRLRYFSRTGSINGANVCRNQGLHEAAGEYVIFLDSDDVLRPHCLAQRVAIMERNHDIDFAVFQMSPFEVTPGDLGERTYKDLFCDDLLGFLALELPWQTTAPIWRRAALIALGGFDENLLSWQDVDLHVRALLAGCRYLKFADVDYLMRWQYEETKISVEQRRSPRHLAAAGAILEKFERLVRDGPGMTWTRQRALCNLYFFVAECWVALGNLTEGIEFWGRIRERRLGPNSLHAVGSVLLRLQARRSPVRSLAIRVCHKWKGWMRLRINAELVTP